MTLQHQLICHVCGAYFFDDNPYVSVCLICTEKQRQMNRIEDKLDRILKVLEKEG